MTVDAVTRGRALYEQRAWTDCLAALREADLLARLGPDDLVLLSISAYLAGCDEDSVDALTRAYHAFLDAGRVREAARSAFWLAFSLLNSGEPARGGGWAVRARQLVESSGVGGAEAGLLTVLDARALVAPAGSPEDTAAALRLAREAHAVGTETGDPDLQALALLVVGHATLLLGHPDEALGYLDQAMLPVSADEVSPAVAGLAYCSVIDACMQTFDLGRAREWTAALSGWCDGQAGLVPYRGRCMVHRAQIMTLQGAWPDAHDEATAACERLRAPLVGDAYYQLGELHRLTGDYEKAEEAFRSANAHGRRPEPGLVRLRAAQGRLEAAARTVRRLSAEEHDPAAGAEILVAFVEVMLAAGDPAAARTGADELAAAAATTSSPWLAAMAARATGSVLLAEGEPDAALALLRRAWRGCRDLDLPYEAARTRVQIGLCLRALGDEDGALMELDAARWVFERLGAGPDLGLVDALLRGRPGAGTGALTPREVDVVRLVAAGLTNRAVANRLFLSEKTVARHLSNVYAKLGISSRAAATAYAYDHGLV